MAAENIQVNGWHEFAFAVSEMRNAQTRYFASNKDFKLMLEAKKWEGIVDQALLDIKKRLAEKQKQPDLLKENDR